MPHDYSTASPKHTPARLALNADLSELVEMLDAVAGRAREVAAQVPEGLNDPDYNAVLIEDLNRLRLNAREAAGAIEPFTFKAKAAQTKVAKGGGK